MAGYDIKLDLNEQKRSYLSVLLLLSFVGSIPLFGIAVTLQGQTIAPHWLCLGGTLLLSAFLRYKELIRPAIIVFLLGLLATSGLVLWHSGPGMNVYLLMLLPLVLSILLLGQEYIAQLAVVTALTIVGATMFQPAVPVSVGQTLGHVLFPVLFCIVLSFVIYFNLYDGAATVHWATDIQQKDTRRAEMFYEQREQLSEALRQLTHAHSRLKTLNTELEIARMKTEHASQAKSIFLSNMSHELRTPLNVIIGYTSTMLDMPQMYKNITLPPNYRADVQLIKDNGYYLLGLINDILDLSKIEAGKLELSRAPIKLQDILRGTIATAIGLVKEKPVQVRPDYADDLPLVYADATRIRQVILNLMSNAIKFTHTGSVTLKAVRDGENVRISVIDTGIGIPEKALPHIFDRFEQAERDTDKHYGGTGLGLDISKQLVKMHGGNLTVESVVGQGSIFSFTIPVSTEQDVIEDKPQLATGIKTFDAGLMETTMPHTILLVEDEASLREMIRRSLEGVGHVVIDIQDGAEAQQTALGLLPDLIILDICLPNMSGWEILESLKGDEETANIPVIVCTVNDDERRALEMGAALYVQKPFSADELAACVQELLLKPVDTD